MHEKSMKSENRNPYLLLTPGPLSTSPTVKETMLKDWCTWDNDYNDLVQEIRKEIVKLASKSHEYTSVLMQGSGTFCVEAALGTFIPRNGKLLVLANGAYGERIAKIAEVLNIDHVVLRFPENKQINEETVLGKLKSQPDITQIAMVHCETTTGMLNPVSRISTLAKMYNKVFILDAMSSFGGIPIDMEKENIDILISSANKCIQGVPGFGFVICKTVLLDQARGNARSLSLDLHNQWKTMEDNHGKWRYTSPTHTVRAFYQALKELKQEGGIVKRYQRYKENHSLLVQGMLSMNFDCFLPSIFQSPIITSFRYPANEAFTFRGFYKQLKDQGFVIYPGKVSDEDTFRIGTIGHVFPQDIKHLLSAIKNSIYWN